MSERFERIKALHRKGYTLSEAVSLLNGETVNKTIHELLHTTATQNQYKMNSMWQGVIVEGVPYGQHIHLLCTKCGTTGTTKNIDCIGARTIFVGCSCSSKYLVVHNNNHLIDWNDYTWIRSFRLNF